MELLTESYSKINILTEGDEIKRNYFIEGITIQGNIKNANDRIYPTPLLEKIINPYIEEYVNKNRAVGELGHPNEMAHKINYENVSHKFIAVDQNGDEFYTKALVLNTPKGKILQNLIEAEVGIGISSRAFGATKRSGGAIIVEGMRLVSLGDVEHEPSAPEAFMTAFMENHDWIYESGELIGIDLNEEIDSYQKIIKNTNNKNLDKIYVDIFKNYFQKLI